MKKSKLISAFGKVPAILGLIALLVAGFALFGAGGSACAKGEKALSEYSSRAAYLIDYDSGEVLFERNADGRYPIASMVKIMTLSLVFDEIDKGNLTLDKEITVSDEAAGMGGSQMFLDAGSVYKIGDLVLGVTVASANDASVALAEEIAGSKEAFIEMMNEKAVELGMENTKFVNVTGLPGEGQYSTARDVTKMLSYLIKHPVYFNYSKIYIENFTHPGGRVSELVNTNKLVRFYDGCDGGKTGFTSDAMYCLSATAKRQDMRVIATVLGAESSAVRNKEVSALFNYAFANYNSVSYMKKGEAVLIDADVKGAKNDSISVSAARDLKVLEKRGDKGEYTVEYDIFKDLKAPLKAGDRVGVVRLVSSVTKDVKCEADLILTEDVEKMSLSNSLQRIIRNWFMGI